MFRVRTVVACSKSTVERASTGCNFAGKDSSTSPGARRFSLSLLLEEGDDDGDVSEVGPTILGERSGAPSERTA